MQEERKIGDRTLRLLKGDLTAMDVDAFVFYARPDLALGSGFGTAISVRGGPKVVEELKKMPVPVAACDAVVSGAGSLKARHIIHAVGPRFQEPDIEKKLHATMDRVFAVANEKGVKTIAFPPMGAGFYVIPLDTCARVMVEAIKAHLSGETGIEEVSICTFDGREFRAFRSLL